MQTFTGPDAPFGNREEGTDQIGPKPSEFTDGMSHTILVVQSAADAAVLWTKPDDLPFDRNNPLAALGTIGAEDIHAVVADGATITLSSSIEAATFKALVTHRGGEIVDADALRREYREAHGVTESSHQNLKVLALAALNYEDVRKAFSVVGSAYFDDEGHSYLSWRVHLLPYLGYNNLYSRFHLDEPWDSPNNLPLLAEMPDVFRSVGDASDTTSTRIQTFTGPDAPFGFRAPGLDQIGPTSALIRDGLSNTILYAEVAADRAVPWTKPDDLEFDVNHPLLGIDTSQGIRTVFFDGGQRTLRVDISAADFSALVTRNGHEVVNPSKLSITGYEPFKNISQRKNELRQIILGMQNYNDSRKRFPANVVDAAGTPLLSWRVAILPYIEEGDLYNQFHFDEPWDSPHNLSLLKFMPEIFRSSGDAIDSSTTSLMYFTGLGAPFPAPTAADQRGPTLASITDGSSNTIAVVEAGAEVAVPWTKPVDLPLDMNNPFSVLGELGEEFLAAYFDGHIQSLSSLSSPGQLKARVTHNGGEILSEPNEIVTNPGFHVLQSGGDTTSNEFGVDTFYVVLDRKPVGQVVIDLVTSDPMAAVLDQPRLTFTAANWDVPQRVAFRGVDNHVANPDQAVDVTLSIAVALSDADFQSVPAQAFSATVIDDEPKVPALMGDYNRDGSVNAADYTVWRDNLGKEHQFPYSGADGNGDGAVAPGDFQTWRENFGSTSSGAASITAPVGENLSLAAAEYLPIVSPAQQSPAAKPIVRVTSRSTANDDDLLLLAVDSKAVNQSATTETYQAIDAALADDTDDAPCDSLSETLGLLR